ncbi:MAG: hypothetical protein WDZ51_08630, partial [Pirellulaceae bacterium]
MAPDELSGEGHPSRKRHHLATNRLRGEHKWLGCAGLWKIGLTGRKNCIATPSEKSAREMSSN